ncbi:oligosaccharide repeat unit polymerase [Candidatus Saccharibacteria bacterium]|nr:oligosaccharide repeat unit polymerase [Candidatus Saccharibacteria bacterium]
MNKANKQKTVIRNILLATPFIVALFTNALSLEANDLVGKVILTMVVGAWFMLASWMKLRSIKSVFENIYVIYGLMFFAYAIIGCTVFILDNMTPRFYYFRITQSSLAETITLYINILCIYAIVCFITNTIKPLAINIKEQKNRYNINNKAIIFFSILALIASALNIYNVVSSGSFLALSTSAKRGIINNEFSHYINLFILSYSLLIVYISIINKKAPRLVVIIPILLFWATVLTCERRMFVTLLIGIALIAILSVKKIRLKYGILAVIVALALLSIGAIRDNITLKNHSFNDVLYSSTTEFYCTFMISNAYIVDEHELQYGKTYALDTITKALPREIYKNKPEDLSVQFMNEYKTNVGFAYNPVAEGLLNFGKASQLIVPIIMIAICKFAVSLSKRNPIYYATVYMFALDFFRGAFSNMAFDIAFCCIIIACLLYAAKNKGERNDN